LGDSYFADARIILAKCHKQKECHSFGATSGQALSPKGEGSALLPFLGKKDGVEAPRPTLVTGVTS
jgi:hypothetical protein